MIENEVREFIFCSECGIKNPSSAKFCANCGTKLFVPELISDNFLDEEQNDDIQEAEQIYEPDLIAEAAVAEIEVIDKPTFWTALKDQVNEINRKNKEAIAAEKERIKQMDRDGIAYCPKCKSTSLSAHKKGFGIGKAIIGAALTAPLGGIGAVGGNLGAKKVRVTCMKCGHQFWAGKK